MPAPIHAKVVIYRVRSAGYIGSDLRGARRRRQRCAIQGIESVDSLLSPPPTWRIIPFAATQGPWLMEQMKAQAEHVGTR